MIVVAQYYTTNLAYGKYTKAINEDYCSRHGYVYHLETNNEMIKNGSEDRAATWYKPKLILEAIEKYNPEAVLFVDADAVFFRDRRIEEFLIDGVDIVATEDYGPSKLNAGVILFRNTQWSKKFLRDWWEIGNEFPQYKHGLWHDQTCFGLLMDRTIDLNSHIRIIGNRELNARDTHQDCFIFHAFSYGQLPCRTIDTVYAKKFGLQVASPTENLTQLASRFNTDKYHTHNYIQYIYDEEFSKIRTSAKCIVEIGVYQGESLKLWKQFFSNASIVGIDKNPLEVDGCVTILADQSSSEDMNKLMNTLGDVDLIIDDGSHRMSDQQITFATLFQKVSVGGIFVIEDLHTSVECLMPEKSWCNWGDPKKTTTLNMLNHFNETGKIQSDYLTDDQCKYLENHIESVKIYSPHPMSITSIIRKK